jgi:hypothetical protein
MPELSWLDRHELHPSIGSISVIFEPGMVEFLMIKACGIGELPTV